MIAGKQEVDEELSKIISPVFRHIGEKNGNIA